MANSLKDYKESILKILGKSSGVIKSVESREMERFSSGSYLLDRQLGGGHVKGKIIELYGDNQSGKTTACIHIVAEFQKKYPNEPVIWLDLEDVFDRDYFLALGVDLHEDRFMLLQPENGEDSWETIISFAKTIQGGLVIVDSVALLLPEKEDEGQVGDAQMASAARMNSQGLRKLMPHLTKSKTTLVLINQMRTNIGGYGDPNVTTGGNGFKYYARTRIKSSVSKGNEKVWDTIKLKLIKANYGNKGAEVETAILYGKGFYKMKELIDLALSEGILKRAGAWYSYQDTNIGQGFEKTVDMLNDNPEIVEEIEEKLKELELI